MLSRPSNRVRAASPRRCRRSVDSIGHSSPHSLGMSRRGWLMHPSKPTRRTPAHFSLVGGRRWPMTRPEDLGDLPGYRPGAPAGRETNHRLPLLRLTDLEQARSRRRAGRLPPNTLTSAQVVDALDLVKGVSRRMAYASATRARVGDVADPEGRAPGATMRPIPLQPHAPLPTLGPPSVPSPRVEPVRPSRPCARLRSCA